MPELTLPEQPRILLVRLSAIGDTIHSLPLAAALRRARPGAYLGWIVEQPAAAIVENNPLLDYVKVVPKGWLKKPLAVIALARELRRRQFDIAIDVQGLTKSAAAALLSGAKTRIGFTRGEGRELAPLLDNRLVAPAGVHIVDKTLSLLTALGLTPPEQGEFILPPCSADDAAAIDAFLEKHGIANGYILLGPWGTFEGKLWPLERFGRLAARLHSEFGLVSVMLGHGARERAAVAQLAEQHADALLPAPDVGLTGVAALARRARLFVGCDSFPMHAASAAGCKTLGLFGVTDPARLGPCGPHGGAVYARLTLPASTRERRRLGNENMLALDVGTVFSASAEMLLSG